MKTKNVRALRKPKFLFTIVGGAVLLNPAFAAGANDELEEVVITGMRASLKASMDIKREAVGVVDAINAEDMGKFPDTNLTEALQRVTGISIDRRNGEGATVTARGFGPAYNIVTLNGRQIPGADAFGGGETKLGSVGSGSRSFDFGNLAAESVSGVEVYKTGRADITSGGIGATINIKTARPLDTNGFAMSVGAKAWDDMSRQLEGKELTPDLSGIVSYTNDAKTWGIGLSTSYSVRDSGGVESTVNAWNIRAWSTDATTNAKNVPLAGPDKIVTINGYQPVAQVTNAPRVGQIYGTPNDVRYALSDVHRERLNSQLTLQFKPIDSVTLTADYTFARNDITQDREEQTNWMQRNGFTKVIFDAGQSVATPIYLEEATGASGSKDFGYEQQRNMQENRIDAVGFNAAWQATDALSFALDYSDAKAKSTPNDPVTGASATAISIAGYVKQTGDCVSATASCTNYWKQAFSFNNGLPIAVRTLYPTSIDYLNNTNGNSNYAFNNTTLASQPLRVNMQSQFNDMKQTRLDGTWDFADAGKFQFGVEARDMEMTQKNSGETMNLGTWGASDAGTSKVIGMVALLKPINISGAFNGYNTSGIPTTAFVGNADDLGQWGVQAYGTWSDGGNAPNGMLRVNPDLNTYNVIQEKTKSAYGEYSLKLNWGPMPVHINAGLRYEKTDVTSRTNMLVPTDIAWLDDNDFKVVRALTQTLYAKDASYHNVLPNLDFDIGLTDTLKARASVSKTMARADYGVLTASGSVNTPTGSALNLTTPATATSNNPGILPEESTNIDLSMEWYFSDNGYLSAGFFNKKVKNFIGNTTVQQNMFGIRDQTGGPGAQAALAYLKSKGLATDDTALWTATALYDYPSTTFTYQNVVYQGGLTNYTNTDGGLQHAAWSDYLQNSQGNGKIGIQSTASDPLRIFNVALPVNNKDAKIHGFEFGGQYFIGDSGFGAQANYTIVKADVAFDVTLDPTSLAGKSQFAIAGLSDSANIILLYEKYGFNARLAWNWRDAFYAGGATEPTFVAPHEQYDLNLGYQFDKHFSVSLEGINLTGTDVHLYGRSEKMLIALRDDSARYAAGFRYKF